MESVPFVVLQSIRPLVDFHGRLGGGPTHPAIPEGGDGAIPLAVAGRLFEQAAMELGDDAVGLRAGAASHFEQAPLGRHVARSPTIGAALGAATRASARYCGGQRLWIVQRGGEVHLHRRYPSALRRGRRQANDFALWMLIDLVRRGAGPHWRPAELHLEGPPPAHAEELAALAARSVRFGAEADRLVFPASVLALPLRCHPRPFPPAASPLPPLDLEASVRQAIRYLIAAGGLKVSNVAEIAGASPRSLQRQLAASGLSFARLVEECRFEEASRLLREPAIRIIDVAVALGYTDAANFTRAFRRWAGVPPLAFRHTVSPPPGRGDEGPPVPRRSAAGRSR